MTPERLAEIKALLGANEQPTPWEYDGTGDVTTEDEANFVHIAIIITLTEQDGSWPKGTGELIAAAPTVIAELLAEVERLQEYEWMYTDLSR